MNRDDVIYHLVSADVWRDIGVQDIYYPATYEQDGFVHATADPGLLLAVANNFYRSNPADYLCLEIATAAVTIAGLELRYEAPAAVGDASADIPGVDTQSTVFPHIYGGLQRSMVRGTHSVTRDDDGRFIAIETLNVVAG
ncbi:MAG: DUF952 domain-containing protein [Pseudomonadota bacterium]